MNKKIISLVLCLILISVLIIPTTASASSNMKSICVFSTQSCNFTDADYTDLANSDATDFVFIPPDTTTYTESEYKTKLAPSVIEFINKLVSKRSNAKIWIGTPAVSSVNYGIASSSLNPFYNYITYIKNQIGYTKWSNNIVGIYMNQESIYQTVNYNNLMSNTEIKLMNDLSYRVHTNLNKEFLWIPYYGYGPNAATIIKNLGYVANKTNIFDYVIIQPHYYFESTVQSNLNGVYYSVQNQAVTYRDGVLAVPKTSNTIIGVEMEMNWKIVPPNNYTDYLGRYNEYVSKFSSLRGSCPFGFYWDGNLHKALIYRINPFY